MATLRRLATPAQSQHSPRPSLPQRFDGAREAIRVDFAPYRSEDLDCMRLAQSTRLTDVLAFIARDGQPGVQAACTM